MLRAKVNTQYEVMFDIGGLSSDYFIESDFLHFLYVQEVGLPLPTFELTFKLRDEKVLPIFNQKPVISLSYADTLGKLKRASLITIKAGAVRNGKDAYIITLTGAYNALGYLQEKRCGIQARMPSMLAMQAVARRHFGWKSNCGPSTDIMPWNQMNETDRDYLFHIWKHSERAGGSFPYVGITGTGEFRYMDARKLAAQDPDIIFTYDPAKGVLIDSAYGFGSNSGVTDIMGQQEDYEVYDMLRGYVDPQEAKSEVPLNIFSDRQKQYTPWQPHKNHLRHKLQVPENVHSKFWTADAVRKRNLTAQTTDTIILHHRHRLLMQDVLDVAVVKDDQIKAGKAQLLERSYGGKYYVQKIAINIGQRKVNNIFKLSRELPYYE